MTRINFESNIGVSEGEILAGRFRIEKVLGAGGMGVVLAAHHLHLNTKVAIKFARQEVLKQPDALRRFMREAQAAARIRSEHVARVLDVAVLDNGVPFQVIEYLEGSDLKTLLIGKEPLTVEQSVDFLLQTCDAIAEAHALGIIHRDLKPANLFCTRRQNGELLIKVLDFGISKILDARSLSETFGGQSATHAGTLLGSPSYMSPEQLVSPRDIDARTDIWSLGVILFELLTGQVPFNGDTLPELSISIATQPTPSLGTFRNGLPHGLEQVVNRCLQKERERRYQCVSELALALRPFTVQDGQACKAVDIATNRLEQSNATLLPSELSLPAGAEKSAPIVANWEKKAAPPRPLGKSLAIAALALAAVGTLGLWALSHSKKSGVVVTLSHSASPGLPTARSASESTAAAPPSPAAKRFTSAEAAPPVEAATLRLQGTIPKQKTNAPAPLSLPVRASSGLARGSNEPPRPICSPPYTVDSTGGKRLKLECF